MITARTLILSSAAALMALSGAQAADLPVKAKAVEYVRICSLYGAGFFYIPGTDTCIKIGGYLRADVTFNGGAHGAPALNSERSKPRSVRTSASGSRFSKSPSGTPMPAATLPVSTRCAIAITFSPVPAWL